MLIAATMLATTCSRAHIAAVPSYRHIFVIIYENRTFDQVIGNSDAPTFTRLAKQYGLASAFYAERHPSQPNYIALLGGDTFGISDDDAFFCKPRMRAPECPHADELGYVDHTVAEPSLTDQLSQRGLTWKGYFEDIPEPGSLAYVWPSSRAPVPGKPAELYAAKHNGFLAFKSVQDDPRRRERIVGFDVLARDIAADQLPNFTIIVPNQCNDMHGLFGRDVPPDCVGDNDSGLMKRADSQLAHIADQIMSTQAWKSANNSAIVITFDESDGRHSGGRPAGCCGSSAANRNNPGGGWIATIVITNHGPRGADDKTPYNHYSLLRTIEQAFGIKDYLRHAGGTDNGVVAMSQLFDVVPRPHSE